MFTEYQQIFSIGSISLVEDIWIHLKIFWTYAWSMIDTYLYDSRWFKNNLGPRKHFWKVHFQIHIIYSFVILRHIIQKFRNSYPFPRVI